MSKARVVLFVSTLLPVLPACATFHDACRTEPTLVRRYYNVDSCVNHLRWSANAEGRDWLKVGDRFYINH
jgi:hypothetical protein